MKQLEITKSTELLKRYKIPFSKHGIAKKAEEAAKIASKIGFPVAMKILSRDIVHKSDIGGVKVGLQSREEVKLAHGEILKKVRKKNPRARIDGILVQGMESGQEVIIGVKKDSQFGSVVMFGLGGVFVEILKDVSFRIVPFDREEAISMIKEIKSYQILAGARGKKPVNIEALADLIIKTSNLASNEDLVELDFNPVIVNEKSAIVVDVRIMVE